MNGPGSDREHFFIVLDDPLLNRFLRVVWLCFERGVSRSVVECNRVPPPGRHTGMTGCFDSADEIASTVFELEIVNHGTFDSDD